MSAQHTVCLLHLNSLAFTFCRLKLSAAQVSVSQRCQSNQSHLITISFIIILFFFSVKRLHVILSLLSVRCSQHFIFHVTGCQVQFCFGVCSASTKVKPHDTCITKQFYQSPEFLTTPAPSPFLCSLPLFTLHSDTPLPKNDIKQHEIGRDFRLNNTRRMSTPIVTHDL